ncbi:TAF6-like RNA polymerase II p300/CBP-associated factor-associated factor 65 kDa subunit 6L [Xenia sp. Carnegie-2017]|uniref:TAF6-like RNA polymerase II p300/CBP-associated factor-associated factor 65 kDa subunit 6L n=1 Tax=Xenia sp. Carnegie-2017 TaxID=2897299 RepID=UPI001F03E9E4|nr:TAF6-like RNA polymerase II p300/CBP-associated factor-associated factor 65 kDa subunit 6L [Xenia sp. Carnegie-2017]
MAKAAKRKDIDQYCSLPRKTIKLLGESVGVGYLSNEVADSISEDASYRIRQIIQGASHFVKHCKRDYITGEDLNRSLFWSHVEPVYGYASKNSDTFSNVSTKDGLLFFHDNKEINLRELALSRAFSSKNELGCSKISVQVSLLNENSASKNGANKNGETMESATKISDFESLSETLRSYYEQVTKNILTCNDKTVKIIVRDLGNNSKIQILLPYFINFITEAMQIFCDHEMKLTRILMLIKAIVENKHLYREPYVIQLARAVMYCLIEKPLSRNTLSSIDDWMLRNQAARVLFLINRQCTNSGNYLSLQLLRTLEEIYHTSERPLHCQYGAITGLAMLGSDAIQQTIFPHLKAYFETLSGLLREDSTPWNKMQALYILLKLKICALFIFRNKFKEIAAKSEKESQVFQLRIDQKISTSESSILETKGWNKQLNEVFSKIYDETDDSFTLLLGSLEDYEKFTFHRMSTAMKPRIASSNKPRKHIVKNLIQNVLENLSRSSKNSRYFTLQAERERKFEEEVAMSVDDDKASFWKTKLFHLKDCHELRFEKLTQNSFHRKITPGLGEIKSGQVKSLASSTRRFRTKLSSLTTLIS